MIRILAVNGYGAGPKDKPVSAEMREYVKGMLSHIRAQGKGTTVYLLGGYTNRRDISEARHLYRAISKVFSDVGYMLFEYVEPDTQELSMYDNLLELASRVRSQTGALDQVLLNLCCHAPRARKAHAMARAAGFVHVTIVPINFGKASLMTRFKWFVYDAIEIAGLHFGPAREFARGLRLKHLAAARHAARQDS